MSILFKNLAKKANDLLDSKKKYTTGGAKKFSINTKTASGITYNAQTTLTGGSVKGKIGLKLQHDSGFSIKKLELDTNGCLASEITLDKAADDVQFTLNVKLEPLNASDAVEESKIGATYTHKDFKANLVVSPMEPTAANASICFLKDECYVGGAAGIAYDHKAGGVDLSGYEFGAGYVTGKSTGALTVKNKMKEYQLSFHHQHSDAIEFAATLKGDTCPADKPSAALEFGGSYKVDNDTKAYGKLSLPNNKTSSATASFNLDHQLNCSTQLGLTSVVPLDFNAAPQFGLNLSFGI